MILSAVVYPENLSHNKILYNMYIIKYYHAQTIGKTNNLPTTRIKLSKIYLEWDLH